MCSIISNMLELSGARFAYRNVFLSFVKVFVRKGILLASRLGYVIASSPSFLCRFESELQGPCTPSVTVFSSRWGMANAGC